jgi:2'-5' RNA ligase
VVGDAIRLFLAVPIPDEVRHGLAHHLTESLAGKSLPGKPVAPALWHFTMRFIGWSDQLGRDKLTAAIDQTMLGPRFRVMLGGLGAFPRPARASVVWVGVERGGDEMAELAALLETIVAEVGFEAQERPFAAHLTLSRLRPEQDVRPVLAAVPPFPARFTADAVVLYESHLGRRGAEYEELERFELGG